MVGSNVKPATFGVLRVSTHHCRGFIPTAPNTRRIFCVLPRSECKGHGEESKGRASRGVYYYPLEDEGDLREIPLSFKVKEKDDISDFTLREKTSGEKEATKAEKSKGSLAEAEEYAEALRRSLEATGRSHNDPGAEFSD